MRILHLLSQRQLTGAEAHALTLAEQALKDGHQVWVCSNAVHLPTQAQVVLREIDTRSRWVRLKNILWLRKFIRDNEIDVIHTHSRAGVRIAWWATLGSRTALVSTIHGRQHFSWSKRFFNLYGDRILAVCPNLADHLRTDFRIPAKSVQVLPNPMVPQTPVIQSTYLEKQKIVFAGRSSGPKGEILTGIMQRVLPALLKENADLCVDFLGGAWGTLPGEGKLAFESLAKAFPNRINWLGQSPDFDSRLKDYALVVGAGRVAISAALQEIPVISFGEYAHLGLLTAENFTRQFASNFGDIGPKRGETFWEYDRLLEAIRAFLAKRSSPEERASIRQKALELFNLEEIHQKVIWTYGCAILKRHLKRNLPILMYHIVSEAPLETKHRIFVSKEKFKEQCRFLRRCGYPTLGFEDIKSWITGTLPWNLFPKKPVIITFDDGYKNNLDLALPILQEEGLKAVIFLLADKRITTNQWDQGEVPELPLLSPGERQRIASSGVFEIGSHGLSHRKLTEMSDAEAWLEISRSRELLEEEFGFAPVSYAFTYGLAEDRHRSMVQRAGYDFAVNTDSGALHFADNQFDIFRVNIFPEDTLLSFWKKTSGWYRKYYFRKRGH
ncbi:MAG: polysaccharide deacetylase family protein [Bdellovibrionaceae bacterium]|nr:polysaccharide deacetylase family protein [Pseudobdellovibrionaceae bacterium]